MRDPRLRIEVLDRRWRGILDRDAHAVPQDAADWPDAVRAHPRDHAEIVDRLQFDGLRSSRSEVHDAAVPSEQEGPAPGVSRPESNRGPGIVDRLQTGVPGAGILEQACALAILKISIALAKPGHHGLADHDVAVVADVRRSGDVPIAGDDHRPDRPVLVDDERMPGAGGVEVHACDPAVRRDGNRLHIPRPFDRNGPQAILVQDEPGPCQVPAQHGSVIVDVLDIDAATIFRWKHDRRELVHRWRLCLQRRTRNRQQADGHRSGKSSGVPHERLLVSRVAGPQCAREKRLMRSRTPEELDVCMWLCPRPRCTIALAELVGRELLVAPRRDHRRDGVGRQPVAGEVPMRVARLVEPLVPA